MEEIEKMKTDYVKDAIGEPAESEKIYCMIEKFVKDKNGLDIGCGGWKIIGSQGIDIRPGVADFVGDVSKGIANVIKYKKKIEYDYIFSSHLLEDFDEPNQYKLLLDWIGHIKEGGKLILYVPQSGVYAGTNVAHKREFVKGDLESMYRNLDLKITDLWYESVADGNGYSILIIGEKPEGWKSKEKKGF